MVAVQLGIPVADALLRIRAHAFAAGQPVATVAAEVVARRWQLDHDGDGPQAGDVSRRKEGA